MTGGQALNDRDNEGDFDGLLLGNIAVGLILGPTKPTTSTSTTAFTDAKDVLDASEIRASSSPTFFGERL